MGQVKVTKTVVRSRDKSYVTNKVKTLKRHGWTPLMEPKSFLMLDGTEEWVVVMQNEKPRSKNLNNPFLKHWT